MCADPWGSETMKAAEALSALAEVSVAFAGFSGIVTAFRQHNLGEWSRLDRFRFRFMIEFSLATLALSLLPFFLSELGLSEPRVWSMSSVVLGAGALFYLVRSALRLRPLVVAGEPVSRGLAAVSVAVGIGVTASALANAAGFFSAAAGVYLAGVGGCLFVSSAMFARLLLGSATASRDDAS
ncbi:MAG: hypothetical protein DCC71_06820 [Proteobacteria bacterium]|nr:MAG: hypothetical protein DCC71_06820 [Pseudomonadota bacterium]